MPGESDLKPPRPEPWKGNEPYIECDHCQVLRPRKELRVFGTKLVCIETGWCSDIAKERGLLDPQPEAPKEVHHDEEA